MKTRDFAINIIILLISLQVKSWHYTENVTVRQEEINYEKPSIVNVWFFALEMKRNFKQSKKFIFTIKSYFVGDRYRIHSFFLFNLTILHKSHI